MTSDVVDLESVDCPLCGGDDLQTIVVVSDPTAAEGLPDGVAAVLVHDTTRALQALAAAVRRHAGVTVAAVEPGALFARTTGTRPYAIVTSACRATPVGTASARRDHAAVRQTLR